LLFQREMPSRLDIPVVFLVFNRPEPTARVFARIRDARPAKLFVVADGPRPDHIGDAEKCRRVRELIAEGIDWPCEVVRDYAEKNLGSGRRVASGITKAFEAVEEAVILEDDCLPDPSFFPFCAELLARYRNEPRVGLIGGAPHVDNVVRGGESYFFCRYGYTWGWATWRRAWARFDYSMRTWAAWRDSGGLQELFPRSAVRKFWSRAWEHAASNPDDIWDYQWVYCYMRAGMLGLLPRTALVENIGFGAEATHTTTHVRGSQPTKPMVFPLIHPCTIEPDLVAEARASERFFSRPNLVVRAIRRFRQWCGRLRRSLAS
jgi:hypothetical protein